MSKYNYIATYMKSSAISDAFIGYFYSINNRNLIISKGSIIEIFSLQDETIEHIDEIEVFSYVRSLCKIKMPNGLDSILALTHSHMLFQIYYQDSLLKKFQISIIKAKEHRDCMYIMRINTQSTLICINDYYTDFRVFKVKNGKTAEKDGFVFHNEGLKVIDMEFIHNRDLIAVLSICDTTISCFLHIYDIRIQDRDGILISSFNINEKPGRILQPPGGNLMIFVEQSYRLIDLSDMSMIICEQYYGKIIGRCEIDATRYLLSNSLGNVYLVIFGPIIETRLMGNTSPANTVVHLDSSLFFFGSNANTSKIIEILQEPIEKSNIKEVQVFKGISPVFDLNVEENSELGIINIDAGSGIGLSGGICKITKSVPVVVETQIDILNINGVWSLNIKSKYDTHIVISVLECTRVFRIEDCSIYKCEVPGLVMSFKTILMKKFEDCVLQVTCENMYMFDENWKILDIGFEEEKGFNIVLACFFGMNVSVVTKTDTLICFDVVGGKFVKGFEKVFDAEISCVGGYGDCIALTFWEENTVQIIKKDGTLIFQDSLGFTATGKSLKYIQLGSHMLLAIGLRDGHLLHYNMENFKKTSLHIGCQAINLEEIHYQNHTLLLASCDKAIFLYSDKNKLAYSSLDFSNISSACIFNTQSYPDSMILITPKTFSIISFEDLQKYSNTFIKKQLTILKIEQNSKQIYAIARDIAGKNYIKSYNENFDEEQSLEFSEDEILNCMTIIGKKLYLGSTITSEIKEEKNGVIRIYNIKEYKLDLCNELRPGGPVKCIKPVFEDLVIAVGSEVLYCKSDQNRLQNIDVIKKQSIIVSMDVYNEYVGICCENYYLIVLNAHGNKLLQLYSYNSLDYAYAVKFLSDKLILVSDLNCNLILFEISGPVINPVSGFNMEKTVPSVLKSFKVSQEIYGGERNGVICAAGYGDISIIVSIENYEYLMLMSLQKIMKKELLTEGLSENLHRPIRRKYVLEIDEFVNGDLVERFLNMTHDKQTMIAGKVSDELQRSVNDESLRNLLYSMHKIH
ncbi:hypothetical protein SteCoe_35060 [Stentor coeruleus]|uniref:DNA damage-binding protein 1 n=1 Tax=Stentor coeruleus TaxID=5963 RepID=A0A1R2AT73_9CILI|nr:hypothetical protein SteCoe_35060 [Stentor coeruleus]